MARMWKREALPEDSSDPLFVKKIENENVLFQNIVDPNIKTREEPSRITDSRGKN